jgi:hypothetical protein
MSSQLCRVVRKIKIEFGNSVPRSPNVARTIFEPERSCLSVLVRPTRLVQVTQQWVTAVEDCEV